MKKWAFELNLRNGPGKWLNGSSVYRFILKINTSLLTIGFWYAMSSLIIP